MANVKLTSGVTGTVTAPGNTDAIPITDNSGAAVLKKITWASIIAKVIPHSTVTAKGDLIVATGSAAVDNLAAGSNFFAPIYHSGETTGMFTKAVPITLYSDATEVSIANSTTETDLWTLTLPANWLTTKNWISIEMVDRVYNESGSDKTFTLKLSYGGNTISHALVQATGAAYLDRFWYWFYRADGSAAAQRGGGWYLAAPSAGTTGVVGVYEATTATDATAAQTLKMTMTISGAHANAAYKTRTVNVVFHGTTQ